MSESAFDWFVQMTSGVALGPMPREDLVELAQSGGLLQHDLVREGEDGDWRPASEVPGLLSVDFDDSESLGETDEATASIETDNILAIDGPLELDVPIAGNSVPTLPPRPTPPKRPGSPPQPVSPAPPRQAPTQPAESTPQQREQTATTNHPVTAAPPPPSKQTPPEPPDWLANASSLDDPPSLPDHFDLSRLEDENFDDDDDWEDSSPYALKAENEPVPLVRIGKKTPSSPGTQTPSTPPRRRTSTRRAISDRVAEGWSWVPRSLRRKLIWAVVGAVALAIFEFAAPSLLPGNARYIYEEFVSIHDEMQAFDDGTLDAAGWNEFTQSASEELDAALPWLEENAVPGDRVTSLLLYVGRDLQEMIRLPPGSERPHQQRVDGFFDQLDEFYASNND